MLADKANVVSVGSVAEAKAILKKYHFDLAILDIGLSDGSGIDLLPVLAKLLVPVIVFARVDIDEHYAQYVVETLVKSETSADQLMITVKNLLDKSLI